MKNSHFGNLIYKIIGKPERWHDDYIDLMNVILDETDSFEDPENFSELALGEQILSQIRGSNDALQAFYTLLDKSRFQIIILDEDLSPIFHNKSADALFESLCVSVDAMGNPNSEKPEKLKPSLIKKLELSIDKPKHDQHSAAEHLSIIDYSSHGGEQLYLRSIQRQPRGGESQYFYIIMTVDKFNSQHELNPELVALYELTDKEQMVLSNLIQGKSIKTIAQQAFVTENTVKTHVKALFRKTDTNSQADIVRRVLTHESQVLDSYFGTNAAAIGSNLSDEQDLLINLPSGQIISYREYGPKNGDPMIVFHNGYGCRLSIPLNHEEVCKRFNKRIIIPDQPGFGKTPFSKDGPKNWHKTLSEFIVALNLESYDILGNVLGCPLAIKYAAHADERLNRIILTSPVFINYREDAQYLQGIFAPAHRLVKTSKRFAREIYELWLKSITLNLSKHYRGMIENSLGDNEHNIGGDKNAFLDSLVDTLREGIRHGYEGISHEMVYCLSPMKLDLSKIKTPVDIWYGTQDGRISQQGAENLASNLPNATLHIETGYSEQIYHSLFEKIIATSCDAPKTR